MRRAPWLVVALALVPWSARAEDPFYSPVGELVPGSGQGAADATVYAPGMRYPIEEGPSFPNSQVWGVGGSEGPGGSQCDAANFAYPWHDNYCETRSWDMPLCPAGVGHQGQDIRASSCDAGVHPYVAARAGTVTSIGSYSVYVTADDGQRFDYLHGANIMVSEGQAVAREQRIGMVSNQFGGTPTTVHLHFNIKQDVTGVGFVFVSPYMSLVGAYEDLMGLGNEVPAGPVDAVDCTSIRGWAQDPDTPEQPVEIRMYFGGPVDDATAIGISVVADVERPDLCAPLGSCAHGFDVEIPRSLQDGGEHPVFVYAVDTEGSEAPQLEASPGQFSCAPPTPPGGVRRLVATPEVQATWGMSTFWDLARLDDATVQAIEVGTDVPAERLVVRGEDDPETALWIIDDGRKRAVDPAIAQVWSIGAEEVLVWPQGSVDGVPEGAPLRGEIFLVSGSDGLVYLIDDAPCPLTGCPAGGDTSGGEGGDDGTDGPAATSGDAGGDEGTGGFGEQSSDGGCGCRSTPTRGGWLLLGLAGLALRRRRAVRP